MDEVDVVVGSVCAPGCTSTESWRGCDTVIDDGLTPAAVATAFLSDVNEPDELDDDSPADSVETRSFPDDFVLMLYSTSVAEPASRRIFDKARRSREFTVLMLIIVIESEETLAADASSVAIAFLTAFSFPEDTTDAQLSPSKRSDPFTITVSDAEIGGVDGAGRAGEGVTDERNAPCK